MSIVLFWSPFHGQGQTSNLHAIALCASYIYGKSVLLMQTQFDKNNFESPLIGQNIDKRQTFDNPLFQDIGLDMAVTYSNMNRLTRNVLESCCISFADNSLLLLPGTESKNRESFDRDIAKAVGRMIKKADEYFDLLLIDANSGEDSLSLKLMALADLIIVNFAQRRYVLDKLFSEYGEFFLDKRVFYLFGNYDDSSAYNIANCRRKYRKYIKKNNSGVIPYSTRYLDAQNEGAVFNFMQRGLYGYQTQKPGGRPGLRRFFASKEILEETRYFFSMIMLTTGRLLQVLQNNAADSLQEESLYEHV